jgi:Protein of unknown function (DUF4235)
MITQSATVTGTAERAAKEDGLMAGKSGGGSRLVSALVGAGAAFLARKILSFGWTKITGKQPPEHPEDPQVALREALIWGIVLGAGVHTARMLATRATTRRSSSPDKTSA